MIPKLFRALLGVVAVAASAAALASPDEAVLGAYAAYNAGDPLRFARYAKDLDGQPLAPWIAYWGLSMRLEDASLAEVREFLQRYRDTYVAERLRGEWLKVLGKRGEWAEFERERALYAPQDLEIDCYAWVRRLEQNEGAAGEALRVMWREPRELPEGCGRLADRLGQAASISAADVWRRARMLFEAGQITAAKTTLGYLSRADSPDERLLAEAARDPKRLLERLPRQLGRKTMRELAVLAVLRYARADPAGAAQALERIAARLPDADRDYLWGRVAYEGAREHDAHALDWYGRAAGSPLDLAQLAWMARAGLRLGRWDVVRDSIDAMPAEMRREPTWTYWYGRALSAQGEETQARAYYLRIAGQTDFYGLLASDELGYSASLPPTAHVPSEDEVAAVAADAGLERALELIRLGIRAEGVREWQFATRNFDDAQLLAASEFARRAQVYDRSIQAADRTVHQHNFSLRYPAPFREVFSEYAKTYGLDEAWVLGLVRQESRFIAEARSEAGAAGLMQVMPRTARYVARKIGLRDYRAKSMTEVQTNVTLGTGYLKMVLDQLGHPVLASAAYNAGPARARRWRDETRPLEGAVYVETIPFPETREYVKKVMANAVFYAALSDREPGAPQPASLKKRLGTIAPLSAAAPLDEDLP
ncbi:MAG TPA: transglycosylase SLT domain-containing protein [Burkholderiales bacterium]|nr:transglycosylase SLT domain-containing protein [Burkholderiales bacterium]